MMFIAFLLEGIGILILWKFGGNPVAFVLLTGLVFFAWGEIYSLFPSAATDLFGRKNATVNYGILYTAKGVAAVGVPLANLLHDYTGNWSAVLVVAAVFNFVAAGLALFALKPMRIAFLAKG
jgi:MFS transporter, OFA family, oxalate/formate antiporter